jgi:two-component system KDP operon response regulator KdpE
VIKHKILIIEDEQAIHKLISSALPHDQYTVIDAYSADEGSRLAATHQPDLIILDIGLPEKTGFEVIKSVREWGTVPIIVLSARSDEQSKIRALDEGANDYVTKPFSVGELLARVRTSLRIHMHQNSESTEISVGPFFMDRGAHIAKKDGVELRLTPTEFKLLLLLIKNANRVISHRQLLHEVWGPKFKSDVQYLRVFMKQLRKKIESKPSQPEYILTEPGIGYRLKCQSDQ